MICKISIYLIHLYHRSRTFKSNQRKLVKYTTQARWYTDIQVGDVYKDTWKLWISRKGRQRRKYIKNNRGPNGHQIPTTTVMFVPKTPNGRLLRELQMTEDKLINLGWRTKLVEKPGWLYTQDLSERLL